MSSSTVGGPARRRGLRLAFAPVAVALILALGLPPLAESASPVTISTVHGAQRPSIFPCRWHWGLATNTAPGKVEADASANCGGRSGSLTIAVKLEKQDPTTKQWHVLRQQTKTWRRLNRNQFVVLHAPCQVVTYRANFDWKLRNTAGRVAAHNHVKTGPQFFGC